MLAKNFVKVARIGEVMSRRIPLILMELSFKFRHQNIVTEDVVLIIPIVKIIRDNLNHGRH